MNPLVIVNARAQGGRALTRWAAIAAHLAAVWPHDVVITADEAAAREAIAAALAAPPPPPMIVAAGGDGAINLVLNAILGSPVALGAIGLGSSNDFHKPAGATLAGVSAAVADTQLMDVGRAEWEDAAGQAHARHFLLNASMGATAEGNRRYNDPGLVLGWLKQRHVGAAIQWATLETLANYRALPARVAVDGGMPENLLISNLGVVKRVHFAGDMRYDTPVTPDDGMFDFNLCHGMNLVELLRAVGHIQAGRFLAAQLPKTLHQRASRVEVVFETPAALELDGEVFLARIVRFSLLPRAIAVARGLPPTEVSPQ